MPFKVLAIFQVLWDPSKYRLSRKRLVLSGCQSLTCHSAIQDLCRAPDQALVVISNGALGHGPVDVVELRPAARILHRTASAVNQ